MALTATAAATSTSSGAGTLIRSVSRLDSSASQPDAGDEQHQPGEGVGVGHGAPGLGSASAGAGAQGKANNVADQTSRRTGAEPSRGEAAGMGQLMVSASPGQRVSAARANAVIAAASAACSSAESWLSTADEVAAATRGDGAHGPPPRRGQGQVGLAAVVRMHRALDQPGGLEPVDHPHRGRGRDIQGGRERRSGWSRPRDRTTSIRNCGSVTPLAPAIERADTATSAREDSQHGIDDSRPGRRLARRRARAPRVTTASSGSRR